MALYKMQLSKLQNDNTAFLYTGVTVIEKNYSGYGRDLCRDTYTGNIEAFLIFVFFCFYLSLKNLKCEVLYLCQGGHLKIHTDICSHSELGQCLLCFPSLPPPLPVPLPNSKRKCSSLLQRYRKSTNLKLFNPIHSSSNTRVYVKEAEIFFLSLNATLYSSHGHMTGTWNPLRTDARPLDLMFRHQCLALS